MSLSLGLSTEYESPLREGAGFWIRVGARLIDTMIHFATNIAAGLAAGILIAIGSAIQDTPPDAAIAKVSETGLIGFLAALAGGIALHTLAEGLHGSTIGKRLCGLTVVSEDGGPASILAALKRNVAYLWDSLFFGFIAYRAMDPPANQRHGDTWARTQVVRIASLDPGARRSWIWLLAVNALGMLVDGVIVFVELASRLVF